MLTHRQRDTFRLAIAKLRRPKKGATETPPIAAVMSNDKVFETEITIEQFFGRYGQSFDAR